MSRRSTTRWARSAPAQFWNRATTVGLAALDAEVTKQASIVAYADDFKLMMLVALVALAADLPAEARQGASWRDGDPGIGECCDTEEPKAG